MPLLRRTFTFTLAAAALLASGCAQFPNLGAGAAARPPIVFVHGNGDSAALWHTTVWRWESNGWPADRLFALNMPNPQARDDDTKEQPGRSGTADQRRHLAAEVDRVLAATGARQVVLVANSRGAWRCATASPTAVAPARCRTPSWAARPIMASGPTRAFGR